MKRNQPQPQSAAKLSAQKAGQKGLGLFFCIFAAIRMISHPAGQNRPLDWVLMGVMFAAGIFLLLAKTPQVSDKG